MVAMTTSGTVPENLQVLFAAMDATRTEREELYTWFHQHPELSMQEERTAARVEEELRAYGCEVISLAGTGRVGIVRNGDGPTVLFRADMDALPIAEDSGLEYAVSKERGLMHACGHDFHTACLLGAIRAYTEHPEAWSGTLIALFQPGEEAGGGAQKMVDDGLADMIPQPDVALAQHVGPFAPDYAMTTRPGALMAEATTTRVVDFFTELFGADAVYGNMAPLTGSEDFPIIPDALSVPYCYWGWGGFPEMEGAPANHSPAFNPALQPTLDTGTRYAIAGIGLWLAQARD